MFLWIFMSLLCFMTFLFNIYYEYCEQSFLKLCVMLLFLCRVSNNRKNDLHSIIRLWKNYSVHLCSQRQCGHLFVFFFFFFCGRSPVLRPSVDMSGIVWCSAGLLLFPTACWWLTHPAAITGVSVSARWDSPGGCGGPSVPPLCFECVKWPSANREITSDKRSHFCFLM